LKTLTSIFVFITNEGGIIMARKDIHNALDMRNKNNHNDNFEELYQLKEVNSDLVLESGESNAEVVQARGGKKVLADRLDGIEDAINEVANTSDIEVSSSKPNHASIWFEVVE